MIDEHTNLETADETVAVDESVEVVSAQPPSHPLIAELITQGGLAEESSDVLYTHLMKYGARDKEWEAMVPFATDMKANVPDSKPYKRLFACVTQPDNQRPVFRVAPTNAGESPSPVALSQQQADQNFISQLQAKVRELQRDKAGLEDMVRQRDVTIHNLNVRLSEATGADCDADTDTTGADGITADEVQVKEDTATDEQLETAAADVTAAHTTEEAAPAVDAVKVVDDHKAINETLKADPSIDQKRTSWQIENDAASQ